MLTRRMLLRRGGCAVLATTIPALIRPARAQTAGFDYYIGPSGSNSNPGTLASPWGITALNSNQSAYGGKRVGIIAGTYSVYALCQGGSKNTPALRVNGGTPGSPTYLASCDANGNYSPRAATLSALSPSGAFPTSECPIIGQGAVANSGNITIDGVNVTGSYQMGIFFYLSGSNPEGGPTGITIQNCEVYNISGNDNDNVAGIYLQSCSGVLIHNCKIHDVQPPTSGQNPQDVAGIYSYYCRSNIYEYNTIYNCNQGIRDKFKPNGNHTVRFNFIEINGTAPVAALGDGGGGSPGDVYTVHHNVFNVIARSAQGWYGNDWDSDQGYTFYNNTMLLPSGSNGAVFYADGTQTSPAAAIQHYNNIYLAAGAPNYQGLMYGIANGFTAPGAISDYNLYGTIAASAASLGQSPSNNAGVPTLYTLANWQNTFGLDKHSKALNAVFANPTSLNPSGFALNAGAPGSASSSSPGSTNGTAGGSACDMGAWGGASPPGQIGCNFGPVPEAPVIISIS